MREYLRDLFADLLARVMESPADRLIKPAAKAAVVVALLTIAAQAVYERSVDRKSLAVLAKKSAIKEPMRTGSIKR